VRHVNTIAAAAVGRWVMSVKDNTQKMKRSFPFFLSLISTRNSGNPSPLPSSALWDRQIVRVVPSSPDCISTASLQFPLGMEKWEGERKRKKKSAHSNVVV
jgi:hypothetical protein